MSFPLALLVVDFLIDRVKVRVIIAAVVDTRPSRTSTIEVATRFMKWRSWLVKTTVPLYSKQGLGQRFDRVDVQVVARFVENQHVVLG